MCLSLSVNSIVPDSCETADHSLAYCIAAAIVDRKITVNSFSEEKMKDKKIWDLINRIKGEVGEEFEKMFSDKQPSRVVIKTKAGKKCSQYLEYPKGDPREPMTDDDVIIKFNSLSEDILSSKKQKEIQDAVFNFEKLKITDFMGTLKVK